MAPTPAQNSNTNNHNNINNTFKHVVVMILVLNLLIVIVVTVNKNKKLYQYLGVQKQLVRSSSISSDSGSKLLPPSIARLRRQNNATGAAANKGGEDIIPSSAAATLQQQLGIILNNIDNNKDCSCWNPHATFECCQRYIHTIHKMGVALANGNPRRGDTLNMYYYYKKGLIVQTTPGYKSGHHDSHRDGGHHEHDTTTSSSSPTTTNILLDFTNVQDYRGVYIFRNIYEALVSGYLYHKSGKECWLSWKGIEFGYDKYDMKFPYWYRKLSYVPTNPPINGRSLCRYLADTPVDTGMRVYVDYAFHKWYAVHMTRWSLSLQYQVAAERTMVVCFEDLVDTETRKDATVSKMLHFLFNGTVPHSSSSSSSSTAAVEATRKHHGTSHDPKLRSHLTQVIKQIDKEYYNGDIEWLANTIWPC